MVKIRLRTFPPEEHIRYEGKRPIAVVFNCQFCGGLTRESYSDVQFQICPECRRARLQDIFDFDLLPHTLLKNRMDDLR